MFDCDSTVCAYITINYSNGSEFEKTACDSYELPWGDVVTQSGKYCHTYKNIFDCDSTVCAYITINYSNGSSFEKTACDSYELPWGEVVTQSGKYCHTYKNMFDCDSTVCAYITIHYSEESSFEAKGCKFFRLPWGEVVTQSGEYTHTYQNIYNCDSIVTGIITIINVNVEVSHTDVLCEGANTGTATAYPSGGQEPYSYVWSTVPPQYTQTATGLAVGTYTVTVTDKNGCTAIGTVVIELEEYECDYWTLKKEPYLL
jgi:hypothetical protein